tara:strand:+ start:403 stop:1182 length:780 start_codon:yes stop_codon:yes gene_type:complete
MPSSKIKKVQNIIKQLFIKKRSTIIFDKLISRFYSFGKLTNREINVNDFLVNLSDFCMSKDSELWEESVSFGKDLIKESEKKLKDIDIPLGGGGAYELLYFLTRYIRPKIIVETGVAAGFSSKAFLTAIHKNKEGKLYSSDFPYFKEDNAEKYIGLLVDNIYKKNWDLFTEGDLNFIKTLDKKIENSSIDLFHYDSDKSYRSRKKTYNAIKKYLKKKCIIIFDDIQDNLHFSDLSSKFENDKIKVFRFNGKYIGMIWNL